MDLDEPEIFEGIRYPDEDSGSAYEESSDNENLSHDEHVQEQGTPTPKPKARGRSTSRKATPTIIGERHSSSRREGEDDSASDEDEQGSSPDTDNQIQEQIAAEAREWAANFQPPASEDIKTPPRRRSHKRRAQKPPSEIRFKRLKPYYDNDYRELLNAEIINAAYGELFDEQLEGSQIGSSTWTAEEKDLFFSSLARLGRDDVRGIAVQVGTKSEPEVQEYLKLLQASVTERKRKRHPKFMVADLPAAAEISEECCLVLERASDALAARQEMAEEKVEKSKWSDIWLVGEEVSLLIERRRREQGGEEALNEVLPAGNLFIFKNWLELSRRVFMNSGAPREEDNWEYLNEAGEKPAIRATAFEDFHSLAVNITKKLLSTTLFCTMSRIRAGDYHYVKVPEVTAYDVEAAVKILGFKSNSEQFWLDCAKRNNLEVVDDGEVAYEKQAVVLTHDDVERELRSSRQSRSRSLSRHEQARSSSQASSHHEPAHYSSPSEMDFEDYQNFETDSSVLDEEERNPSDDSPELTNPDSPTSKCPSANKLLQARKEAERAQAAYTETLDTQVSQKEEAQLWALIEQEPPFEIETKFEELERPSPIRPDIEDGRNWRDHVEYWSSWETMRTPVPKAAFERNRGRKSRRAKARAKRIGPQREDGVDGDAVQDEELESEVESELVLEA
ncbi:uncharacterized protein PAC_12135 [Phialocephala subalpina]|uniref:SANT domain-containing protein n=1 Tax=Phialocephala subalpina TaxID=576137 RepID=A0A1L7XB30_9HELO|nr:uncharacterized protein PAC_12135 [Phialocephala subalpina]